MANIAPICATLGVIFSSYRYSGISIEEQNV